MNLLINERQSNAAAANFPIGNKFWKSLKHNNIKLIWQIYMIIYVNVFRSNFSIVMIVNFFEIDQTVNYLNRKKKRIFFNLKNSVHGGIN